jgi:hypothetical protein
VGWNITTGNNNIEIGSMGFASDASSIRLGTHGTQKKTYVAGIYGTTATGGFAVEVTGSGQLLSFVKYCDTPKAETRTLARRKSARVVTILSNYQ